MSEVSTLPSLVHLLLYQRISRRESNQFSNADLLVTNFECLICVKLKGYSINIISMDHSSLIPLLNALLQAWLTRGSSITRPFVWSFPFMTSFSRGTLLIGRTRMQVEARYIFLSGLLYKMTIPLSITNSRCPIAKFSCKGVFSFSKEQTLLEFFYIDQKKSLWLPAVKNPNFSNKARLFTGA